MTFIGLKIVGFILWSGAMWYIGRNWPNLNSVTDFENAYKKAIAQAETLKTNIQNEATAAEAKAASLKSLIS